MAMGNPNPNLDNLQNIGDLPRDKQLEITSAGGKASGEARRRKKVMREGLELLLSLPSQNKKANAQLKTMGINPEDADNQMVMLAAMFAKACKGDTFAAAFIRDTVGDKPTDKHAVEVDTGLLDDIMTQLGGDNE